MKKSFNSVIKAIKLPHFSRINPANKNKFNFKPFLIGILIFLISGQIGSALYNGNNEEVKLKNEILLHPFKHTAHENLASFYLDKNIEEAKKEYLLADEIFSSKNLRSVLGESTSPRDKWIKIENRKKGIGSEITYWNKVLEIMPDYSYAKTKLAVLYYQINDIQMTETLINQVLSENPIKSVRELKMGLIE